MIDGQWRDVGWFICACVGVCVRLSYQDLMFLAMEMSFQKR